MAITPDYLREAGEVLTAAASVREAAATWRTRDPAMRVVVVDAMDMRDETPALVLGNRRVFLATSNGHCWTTTQQAAEATALILTQD
jgi:DNA-binding IclR family transcriptional regulator